MGPLASGNGNKICQLSATPWFSANGWPSIGSNAHSFLSDLLDAQVQGKATSHLSRRNLSKRNNLLYAGIFMALSFTTCSGPYTNGYGVLGPT